MGISDKNRKQFSFDLVQEELRRHYSQASPQNAYAEIGAFLRKEGFRHIEGSVYESKEKFSVYDFNRIMKRLMKTLPWFSRCVGSCHVADISSPHDITQRFRNYVKRQEKEDARKPDTDTSKVQSSGVGKAEVWGENTGRIYRKALAKAAQGHAPARKDGKGVKRSGRQDFSAAR